jgi:hypothetical protein
VATPVPVETAAKPADAGTTRGILLVIVGLIGIGLLAVILRTPREEPMTIIKPDPVANNIEPMRKPQAAPPPPTDTRAAG